MRYSIQGRACRDSAISVTRGLQLRLWIKKTPQVADRYCMEATPHHTHFKKQTLVNQLSNPKQPEWIRLPRAGERCPYSNLSRSTLNNLILPCKANKNRPPVKSSVVRQKGATRGVRLIHRASLMAYIEAGKETAFGQNANISSNGSLRSLKERLSAITGVQNFSIGGNEKAKMGSLISFKAPGDGVHGWIMRAALKAKRADCSVKLLDRWPLATSKAYCLSENQYAQANHLRDKLFHQKQSTSNEAPVGVNGQKATKKDSNSDRPPHAPILMNSTPLITIDRDDDPHHSTVNAAHDLRSDSIASNASPLPTNLDPEDSFDEVDSEIAGDEDSDPYGREFEPPRPIIQVPTYVEIEAIDLLGLDLVRENLHHDCRSRYEFDWLNLRAYADNWDILDLEMQKTIRAFVDSDLRGNNLNRGMKRRDEFHKHLLMLAGSEIWNIRQYSNTNMVLSNLRDQFGNYSWPWTKDRHIDARDCNQAANEFCNHYDLRPLFQDFNAQIIQFEACSGYRHQPEPGCVAQTLFKRFFQENAAILKSWTRSGLIYSYIYSHEISCDSILGMRFRPHTHAIVFFKKGPVAPDFEAKMRLDDRRVTTTGQIHTRYETLEKFIRYLYGAYSLVGVYERERRDDNLLNLNRKTVQAIHAILELPKGDALESGVQRNNHSYIPTNDPNRRRWLHPLDF